MKKMIGSAVVSFLAMSGSAFAHVGDHAHVPTSHFVEHLALGGIVLAVAIGGYALLRGLRKGKDNSSL